MSDIKTVGVTYVGPFDSIDTDYGTVAHGEVLQVPPAVAKELAATPNFDAVKAPTKLNLAGDGAKQED